DNIDDEVADRTALIRNVGGKIHIGQNSLVTSEAGGFQELSAQTIGGGSIDINVTNGSDLRVNGVSVATDADVASEANARTIADTLIRTDFAAADTTERNARIAADNSIRSDFAAADSSIRNEFQTADRNLRSDIDTNTRGIAMVAAMTNTTIQPGMNHGVDFNISQFESETGFAFGYAHRVNENVQVHGSAASTTDFDESVGRLGVSFQW
ncbi:MAG: YadA-like family protein, partial [Verrucomicrobia bacterium]|nr:YadA-like family protein [Verrucomicrobiota bacterium]